MLQRIKVRECPGVLLEEAFVRTLGLERKRTERSLQPFLLMLVDLEELLHSPNGEKAVYDIMRAFTSVTRETDTCGWYTQNSVLGVIFLATSAQPRKFIRDAIESRIWSALGRQLGMDQREKIRLSFEFIPETVDQEPPSRPAKRRLYPDLHQKDRRGGAPHALKRVMDVVGSLVALVLLLPLLAVIALFIKVTSKGPILFRQTRIGQYGIPFTFFKFRSMHSDSNPEIHREYVKRFIAGNTDSNCSQSGQNGIYKLTCDPRIMPFGRFLRRTSLDELPQFWNVLRGEMSLVGPRPPTPYESELYQPWHWRRILEAKPGITGLWQVKGRSKVAFDEMVRLDIRYVKAQSIWLDFKIILQTPKALFSGDGAY